MKEPIYMPIDAVRPHPRHREVFGETNARSNEIIRASIVASGLLKPFVMTPADAKDNPSVLVDGHKCLEICLELGFPEVPVIIEDSLKTEIAQVSWMYGIAQRAEYTLRERAKQAEAFRAYIASLPRAKRRAHYGDKEPAAIVAMVVSEPKANVHRLRVVFGSATSTDALKRAVDSGRLPLLEAYKIIIESERRRAPATDNARRLVDSLLQRALEAREAKRHGKWRRAPRTPVFNTAPKAPSFMQETQRQVAEWALSETPPNVRNRVDYAAQVNAAVKDLMVELRAAGGAFKARLRRLAANTSSSAAPSGHLPKLNEALAVLNLPSVRGVERVNLDEVKRTHRLLARALHPDVNAAPGARDAFERMHGAYETVLEICPR